MTDKTIALIGVAVLFVVVAVSMSFAPDASHVAQLAALAAVGGGVLVNLWRLGNNTEKTEKISKDVNGVVDARVAAAHEQGYTRGKLDGAESERQRVAEIQEAVRKAIEEERKSS